MGWELNDMLTTNFYRIQIPDPTTKWIIVAPYISFSIQRERAEVQGTYGKGYPIHNRRLEPIPVDYYCPPFTPEQITLLDATAEHAHALTTVVDEKFPIDLSTALSGATSTSKRNSTPPKQKSNNSKNAKCGIWKRQHAFFQNWRTLIS